MTNFSLVLVILFPHYIFTWQLPEETSLKTCQFLGEFVRKIPTANALSFTCISGPKINSTGPQLKVYQNIWTNTRKFNK